MALPKFVSDEQFKVSWASNIATVPDQLVPLWDVLISEANQAGTNEVYGQLAARGYTPQQIAGWDRGAEFSIDMGCWWLGNRAAMLAGFPLEAVKNRDRRKDFETVTVTINGSLALPAVVTTDGQAVGIAGGRLTAGFPFGYCDSKGTYHPPQTCCPTGPYQYPIGTAPWYQTDFPYVAYRRCC